MNFLLLMVLGSMALSAGLLAIWVRDFVREVQQDKRRRLSRAWPRTEAIIQQVEFTGSAVAVRYAYQVSGESHNGWHQIGLHAAPPYRFRCREADLAQLAQKHFNKLPVGGNVVVSYNPKNLAESVLIMRAEPVTSEEISPFDTNLQRLANAIGTPENPVEDPKNELPRPAFEREDENQIARCR